jgi:hypothetical protein
MSDDTETKPKAKMTVAGVIDWLTTTIGKITALVVAVGALVAAVINVISKGPSSVPAAAPASTPATACYRLKLDHEAQMPIRLVNSSKWFHLVLENGCKDDLSVRVEFKEAGGGIVIDKSDTWPSYTVLAGETLDKRVNPPKLTLLTTDPQIIQILVSIYRNDDQKLLRVDTFQIEMVA